MANAIHREQPDLMTRLAKAAAIGASLLVSANAMALAIASPSFWWLGWLTLLPLLLAIRLLSPGRAAVAGSFWGLCFYAISVGGAGAPLAPSLLSALLLAAIPGIYAGLGSRITRRVGFSPLLLGLGWVGVELALKPLALHHGLLAGTQGEGVMIRVVGNVAGYALVAFLLAYVSACLLSVLGEVYAWARSKGVVRAVGSYVQKSTPLIDSLAIQLYLRATQPRGPPVVAV